MAFVTTPKVPSPSVAPFMYRPLDLPAAIVAATLDLPAAIQAKDSNASRNFGAILLSVGNSMRGKLSASAHLCNVQLEGLSNRNSGSASKGNS